MYCTIDEPDLDESKFEPAPAERSATLREVDGEPRTVK